MVKVLRDGAGVTEIGALGLRHSFDIVETLIVDVGGRQICMHAATFSPPLLHAPSKTTTRTRRLAVPGVSRLREIIGVSKYHGLWIAAWSVVGWVGTALAPALVDHAFLLMMLSPRALFVAMASDSVSLVPFVLFGTLRLSVTDASYYIIGRRFPRRTDSMPSTRRVNRVTRMMRRFAREGDQICRWFCARPRLAGAFLFFRPNGKYLGVAGAYGVKPRTAGLSAATGTAVFLAAMHIGIGAIF